MSFPSESRQTQTSFRVSVDGFDFLEKYRERGISHLQVIPQMPATAGTGLSGGWGSVLLPLPPVQIGRQQEWERQTAGIAGIAHRYGRSIPRWLNPNPTAQLLGSPRLRTGLPRVLPSPGWAFPVLLPSPWELSQRASLLQGSASRTPAPPLCHLRPSSLPSNSLAACIQSGSGRPRAGRR